MLGNCPTEFSFNPNQTLLNKLTGVFRITRKLKAGDFFSGLELNSVVLGHYLSQSDSDAIISMFMLTTC